MYRQQTSRQKVFIPFLVSKILIDDDKTSKFRMKKHQRNSLNSSGKLIKIWVKDI